MRMGRRLRGLRVRDFLFLGGVGFGEMELDVGFGNMRKTELCLYSISDAGVGVWLLLHLGFILRKMDVLAYSCFYE